MSRGVVIDSYILSHRLAVGGMGEVWLAHDTRLDRPIAIKVLLPDRGTHAALLRSEARSLAQLSHPNVVTVHQTSWGAGRDFIAMEYVDGSTLAEWASTGATLSERLDVMIEAGRGLSAAHDAGIIHRDFKPSNVLIGHDGRVKVSDFGLARVRREVSEDLTTPVTGPPTSIAGTPLYMAPEHLRGQPTTEAGDQYSFAVSLFEVLFGMRPFTGATTEELVANIEAGPPEMPNRHRVPRWLRAAVARGLHPEPSKRFPSVGAFVAALEDGRTRRRRRKTQAAAAGIAGATAVVVLAIAGQTHPRCAQLGTKASDLWPTSRAETIGAHLTNLVGSQETTAPGRISEYVDGYAARWRTARQRVCRATQIERTQSAELMDRRYACLDNGLRQLDAALSELPRATDPKQFYSAMEALFRLPSPGDCATAHRVVLGPPRPTEPARLAELEAIEAHLAHIDAALKAGRPDVADETDALVERAVHIGYPPLLTQARRVRADALSELGRAEEAIPLLRSVLSEAGELRDPSLEARVGASLVWTIGVDLGRIDEAMALVPFVLASRSRIDSDRDRGAVDSMLTVFHNRAGRFEEALTYGTQAIHTLEPLGQTALVELAAARKRTGEALRQLGRHEEAAKQLQQALNSLVPSVGEAHSLTIGVLVELGVVASLSNRYQASEAWYMRALAAMDAAYGGEISDTALVYSNLGIITFDQEQLDRSLAFHLHAAEINDRANATPNRRASCLNSLGSTYYALGRLDDARNVWEQSLALKRKALGHTHPHIASTLVNLGAVIADGGTPEDGEASAAQCETALEIWETALPHDHYLLHHALQCIGRGRTLAGRPHSAIAPLERAWALQRKHQGRPADRASVADALARALHLAGKSPERVHQLAAEARALYRTAGEDHEDDIAKLNQVLGEATPAER